MTVWLSRPLTSAVTRGGSVQPPHHGLVLLEYGEGARMLPVVFEGRDELAEHRRGVGRTFQRASQRPDSQVGGSALDARVAEVVQRPGVLRAGAVPALGHRRGGLCQVIEPGEPRGSRYQPRHLAQRQRLAVRAHMPQQTRDIVGCQQALCLLKLFSHTQTLAKRRRSAGGGRSARLGLREQLDVGRWHRFRTRGQARLDRAVQPYLVGLRRSTTR